MDFPEVKAIAQNLTALLKISGLALFGVALSVGLIMLMFSWGDERKEGVAKRGMMCAVIGAGGLAAIATLKIIIARVFNVPVW